MHALEFDSEEMCTKGSLHSHLSFVLFYDSQGSEETADGINIILDNIQSFEECYQFYLKGYRLLVL